MARPIWLLMLACCVVAGRWPAQVHAGRDLAAAQRTPDIHFAATPQPVIQAMLRLAQVTPADVVFDLGSGDGRIAVVAAQQFGARAVGIELQPRLVEISRQVAQESGLGDRVSFIQGDLFTADLSTATVVTMWLSGTVNARLAPKLMRELRPGTRVVSRQFPIEGWPPTQVVRVEPDGSELYLWVVR